MGLSVIGVVFVALTLALQLMRTPPAGPVAPAGPTGTPDPTYSEQPIPDEARTSVYRSGVAASGVFLDATRSADPTLAAPTTNVYRVRVEEGINVDPDAAASFIQGVLDNPRGWAGFGRNNFRLVGGGDETAAFTVTIAAPATVDALCGADAATDGRWSCHVDGQVVLNSDRWHYLVPGFATAEEYRAWMVNHYVGRQLGQRVAFCRAQGTPAPVMAEQDHNLDGCLPNAWPRQS